MSGSAGTLAASAAGAIGAYAGTKIADYGVGAGKKLVGGILGKANQLKDKVIRRVLGTKQKANLSLGMMQGSKSNKARPGKIGGGHKIISSPQAHKFTGGHTTNIMAGGKSSIHKGGGAGSIKASMRQEKVPMAIQEQRKKKTQRDTSNDY